ncbi:MAG: secondary thiamine-phosphate synthase enzyme YjbQ [Chloroflexota bacterium]
MHWDQVTLHLSAKSRGFHLITREIVSQIPTLKNIEVGLMHVFIQHTSASLALNENADPTVRADLRRHFDLLAPENAPHYEHTFEGPDDMPAHIKSILTGNELTIPIKKGQLALGTWQGIYLCEHRNYGGSRRLVVTIQGKTN